VIDRSGDPHRATATPIWQTATFAQASAQSFSDYDYSRSGNPTRTTLEAHLAALDGGVRALCYGSGVAAVAAVLRRLAPGDEVLAHDDLYGGTWRLLRDVLAPRGIAVRPADLRDPVAAAAAWSMRTRLVFVESLSNPLLHACPLAELARLAHARGARLAVDATAVSPLLQRPLEHGADYVVHSATKYLGGHGDLTAGVVVVRDEAAGDELAFLQNAEGSALSPFESFLLLRSVQTLALRLERQQANAQALAAWLAGRSEVAGVMFPGLPDHPTAAVHAAQASGPGAVVSFRAGDPECSRRVVEALRLFRIAVSFGGVQSSASLPSRMSHRSVPADRRASGLGDDLVRLSVGIEDVRDLQDDLAQALAAARAGVDAPRTPAAAARGDRHGD
jgi:cystathionine beta-lyase